MTDATGKRYQKANLDSYPSSNPPAQDGLPFALDGADAPTAPSVQANGRAASNSQAESHAEAEADPFDLASLRLSQDFASAVGVKRLITTVPIRKPSMEWFVRTHSDAGCWYPTAVLELKEDREIYLVAKNLWPDLASERTFSSRLLVASINRQGVLFLWPIRLPGADGKIDEWSRSAMEAAHEAKSRWVRVAADMSLGAYRIEVATGRLPDPAWPEVAFQEIIRIAFRDKMISDWNHPVLQRLRGEV